jgi:2-succinyl-6-hydroxy-2,4-cyclohexadiene-1-carboxylate synthase
MKRNYCGHTPFYCAGNSHNPTLIFLHGFMGSGADWLPVMESLSDRFYCIAPELPGHHSSPLPLRSGFRAYSQTVLAQIKNMTRAPCSLVGYSMGGRIALHLGLHHPTLFHTIILESASPGLPGAEARKSRKNEDLKVCNQLKKMELHKFLNKWFEKPIFRSLSPELKQTLIRSRRGQNPQLLARVLQAAGLGHMPSLWLKLRRNTVPQLLITGELDTKFKRIAAEMKRAGTGLKAISAPGCSHIVHLENPQFFIRQCRTFLVK